MVLLFVFFLRDALTSIEDVDLRVNGEHKTKYRTIKTKVSTIFFLCTFPLLFDTAWSED